MFSAITPCRSVFRNTISCAPIACRSSSAYRVEEGGKVRAAPDFLPIESNSIDLVLLPHILEFSANPHQILREVHRVLVPEGHDDRLRLQPAQPVGRARAFRFLEG